MRSQTNVDLQYLLQAQQSKNAWAGNYDAITWKLTAVNHSWQCEEELESEGKIERNWSKRRNGGRWKAEGAGERRKELLCWLFGYVQRKATDCEGLKWGNGPCCNAIICRLKETAGWALLVSSMEAWGLSITLIISRHHGDWRTAEKSSECFFQSHLSVCNHFCFAWSVITSSPMILLYKCPSQLHCSNPALDLFVPSSSPAGCSPRRD